MQLASGEDTDFQNVVESSSTEENDPNYTYGYSKFSRHFFLVNTIRTLIDLRSHLLQQEKIIQTSKIAQEDQEGSNAAELGVEHLNNITKNDESVNLAKDGLSALADIEKDEGQEINTGILINMLISQFQKQIVFILVLICLDVGTRILLSVLFKQLFFEVSLISPERSRRMAYLLAVSCGFLWYVNVVIKNNFIYQANLLVARIKSQFIYLIYLKISKLSTFNCQSKDIGIVINLISHDFNIIEANFQNFMEAIVSPFSLIGMTIVLIARFDQFGLVIIGVMVVSLPFHFLIAYILKHLGKKASGFRDIRVKRFTEALEQIKPIKMYNLQNKFIYKIINDRQKQTQDFLITSLLKSFQKSVNTVIGDLSLLICFILLQRSVTKSYLLSTSAIMATIDLLSPYRTNFDNISNSITFYRLLENILERFCFIFNNKNVKMVKIDEQKKSRLIIYDQFGQIRQRNKFNKQSDHQNSNSQAIQQQLLQDGEVVFKNFSAYWKMCENETPVLKNINLYLQSKSFVGVTGKIGSGKSTFLLSILGQIRYYSGSIAKKGKIAYVSQEPYICSGTIRQNILFGQPFEQAKYLEVITRLSLKEDFQQFKKKDLQILIENGANLSTGQKSRIVLARTLYYDPDIYLLDDPVSSLDCNIANNVYKQFILKERGRKTIILITHQINYLKECDGVIIMEKGRIANIKYKQKTEQQEYSDMSQSTTSLSQMLQEFSNPQNERTSSQQFSQENKQNPLSDEINIHNQQLQQEVSCRTYPRYFYCSEYNSILIPLCFVLFFIAEAVTVYYIKFIAQYDDAKFHKNDTKFQSLFEFWLVIGLFVAVSFIFNFFKIFALSCAIFLANDSIHSKAIKGVINSPCSNFDTAPISNLTNKISNDLGMMDGFLLSPFAGVLEGFIGTFILLASVTQIDKFFLIPGSICLVLSIIFFMSYRDIQSAVRKLDLRLKTPVITKIRELISGLTQIRIFNRRLFLLKQFAKSVDQSQQANISYINIMRALSIVLADISVILVWSGFLIGIAIATPETANFYSVSVIFLVQITGKIENLIKQTSSMESNSISTERLLALVNFEEEQQFQYLSNQVFKQRPLSSFLGPITVKDLNFKFRQHYPLVLKNLNFIINQKQKIAIVGKNGSGKSALIQVLLRLYEPMQGSIYTIGTNNALAVSLKILREHIEVIPQIPFLFEGSLRQNLDLFNQRKDFDIWKALEQTEMKQKIQKVLYKLSQYPNQLDTQISSSSQFLSLGQKQLLCFTRALLNPARILILDEPTSSVDRETKKIISRCIQRNFQHCTIINVTKNLIETAIYDRIMVLDKGQIVQIAQPQQILQNNGLFKEMLINSGFTQQQFLRAVFQRGSA